MDGPGFLSCNQLGMCGNYMDTYPREVTSEADRGMLNTSRQKPACGNMTSRTEALCPDVMERLEKVEKELCKTRVWCVNAETRLQILENNRQSTVSDLSKMQETSKLDPPYNQQQGSSLEALSGRVTQKELEEENQKMKEKIKRLETRNNELLSKMMSMHKQSENMNDPSRLSAVVQLYEMLRLHDWEKFKKYSTNMTYKNGRSIIKKLFDTCEKDIEKRKNDIFNVLDVSSSNYAMANCKQELMPIVTELLRNAYCQQHSDFYKKITKESPVKAVWHTQEIHPEELEHVDKKDLSTVHGKKVELLWPVLKSGEELIAKGAYDLVR